MKNSILRISVLLLACTAGNNGAYSQSPKFIWAEKAGGTGWELAHDITTDGSGHILVVGLFEGSATFDDTITLRSRGSFDIFVTKYDESGNSLWARGIGGSGSDLGGSVATDESGNVLVTGSFSGSANFGDTTLTVQGEHDTFIAKYDEDGNPLWVRSAGRPVGDSGNGIATDGFGNVVVVGNFQTAPYLDMFIAKYDTDGNMLWIEEVSRVTARGVDTDSFSHSFVVGEFESNDKYIACYDSHGNLLWELEKREPGTVTDIATDSSGNIFVCGYLAKQGGHVFVAKYDSSANKLWERQSSRGIEDPQVATGIAIDKSGNSIITGRFSDRIMFGSITLTSAGRNVPFDRDIFLASYDASGNFLWALRAGGTERDSGTGVAIGQSGHAIVAGFFQGTATFGPTSLTAFGQADIFLAKVDRGIITGLGSEVTSPKSFTLFQNYPNPFNPQTKIAFQIAESVQVRLAIYNLLGQEVITLVDEKRSPGEFVELWDGNDRSGKAVPSGVYVYRLQAGEFVEIKKMILLR
ncbi:MAG: T9SS type A sorting domain-containing protein [Nitrospirae bacterium]|nr:T9SS type A sorting domain-containing protein [Nitrospirota bacterium]